ncbi:hypothetical protein GEV33_002172 [Tenebrio molitor]|nr:hypothetical protein GEV33_002172 [Tenebrio molitor]
MPEAKRKRNPEAPTENPVEDQAEQVEIDREEPGLPPPKRKSVPWQETLLTLIANQQEQIAELRKSNMAGPTPSTSTDGTLIAQTPAPTPPTSLTTWASFRLSEFDPDKSNFTIEEWLEDASKLKGELGASDLIMIAKAGEALRGRAYRYYCDWRPVRRGWEDFCKDLGVAFPDRETPGVRAFMAATLRSKDCESLSDYGNQKLRRIYRFCDALPWATRLSMVEYGLDHAEAQASIRIRQPGDERELLKLLSEIDGHRRKHQTVVDPRSCDADPLFVESVLIVAGLVIAKKTVVCRRQLKKTIEIEKPEKPTESKVSTFRKRRTFNTTPIATALCNHQAVSLTYIIDSGADISVIGRSTVEKLQASMSPTLRVISGLGTETIPAIGTCEIVVVLPNVSIDVLFTVVQDDVMPSNLAAIIGWEVISRPNVKIKKGTDGLELHHDLSNTRNVLTIEERGAFDDLQVTRLAERNLARLKQLLIETQKAIPDHITTGKLTITLKDDIPEMTPFLT